MGAVVVTGDWWCVIAQQCWDPNTGSHPGVPALVINIQSGMECGAWGADQIIHYTGGGQSYQMI